MVEFLLAYVLPFIAMLTLLVFVHELGHYLAARLCGVGVDVFSIGFGREIFGVTDRAGTRWRFSAVPLGGYVRFAGDADATSTVAASDAAAQQTPSKASFHTQPLLPRAIIVFAGPAGNFVFAIVALALLFAIHGQTVTEPRLGRVLDGSPADLADLRAGDLVETVNGTPVRDFDALHQTILLNPGRLLTLSVARDGAMHTIEVTPRWVERFDANGLPQRLGDIGIARTNAALISTVTEASPAARAGLRAGDRIVAVDGAAIASFERLQDIVAASDGRPLRLGIERAGAPIEVTLQAEPVEIAARDGSQFTRWLIGIERAGPPRRKLNPVSAVGAATVKSYDLLVLTGAVIGEMVVGARSTDWLGGPLRIAQFSGHAVKVGFEHFVLLAALLSINLGAINLLPIPALDGGHLLFYALEKARGRPLTARVQAAAYRFGLVAILCLAGFVVWNDVVNLGLGEKLVTLVAAR